MYQRVLFATDGSQESIPAQNEAIQFALQLHAEILAVKVIPRFSGAYFQGSIALDASKMKDGDIAGLGLLQKNYGFVGLKFFVYGVLALRF